MFNRRDDVHDDDRDDEYIHDYACLCAGCRRSSADASVDYFYADDDDDGDALEFDTP